MVLAVNMDESRLRTQASARAIVDDDDTEYLQTVREIIPWVRPILINSWVVGRFHCAE